MLVMVTSPILRLRVAVSFPRVVPATTPSRRQMVSVIALTLQSPLRRRHWDRPAIVMARHHVGHWCVLPMGAS